MLIEEYFSRGGLEIQFNTLDKETLSAAQKDPYKYCKGIWIQRLFCCAGGIPAK